jgi:homoserine kinase
VWPAKTAIASFGAGFDPLGFATTPVATSTMVVAKISFRIVLPFPLQAERNGNMDILDLNRRMP